jgi:hypothetical protein
MVQGGDFTKKNGTGGESVYGGTFDDEDLTGVVDKEGWVVAALHHLIWVELVWVEWAFKRAVGGGSEGGEAREGAGGFGVELIVFLAGPFG